MMKIEEKINATADSIAKDIVDIRTNSRGFPMGTHCLRTSINILEHLLGIEKFNDETLKLLNDRLSKVCLKSKMYDGFILTCGTRNTVDIKTLRSTPVENRDYYNVWTSGKDNEKE